MKKFIYIIIILFFYSASDVFPQQLNKHNIYQKIDTTYTLNSSKNKLKMSISLVNNYYDNEFWYREYWVKVYNPIGETVQMFTKINYEAERKDDFELQDINFDNYDDLMILVNENPFNSCYEFWVYDMLSHQYMFDKQFSSLVTCNPGFNKESKTIDTGGADGNSMTFWNQIYSCDDGKLVLIQEESQDKYELIDSTTYRYSYKRVKKVKQDGEMVIVKEVIGTLEDIDEKWGN